MSTAEEPKGTASAPPGADAGRLLQAMSDAVLGVASAQGVESVLQRLVEAAGDLVGARFAALGVPDGQGAFASFLTTGMSDELVERIGPLPRTHGLLGAMLEVDSPYRSDDIRSDPRFQGWPPPHPVMTSFLGVPIVSKGAVIGAFYLTNKKGEREFDEADQQLIEMLAAHAAVAIENARLYERSRELSIVEERNRVARELHDAVAQTLFAVILGADTVKQLLETDVEHARLEVDRLRELARSASAELRSAVFELRAADLEAEGLGETLRKHVEVTRRAYGLAVDFELQGEPKLDPSTELELFRIVQEALHNAVKHSGAAQVRVALQCRGTSVRAEVADDGVGFDPQARDVRARRLGLTSMDERARAVGARLELESTPGRGTRVVLEL